MSSNVEEFDQIPGDQPSWLRVLGRQIAGELDRQSADGGMNAALVARYRDIVAAIETAEAANHDSDDGLEDVVSIDVRRKIRDKASGQ